VSDPIEPDHVMERIGAAMALGHAGDQTGARAAFEAIWAELGPDGDPFHRVAVAHSMADVQDDVHEELRWDLLALEAADELTDERVHAGGVTGPVAAFYPSLHLNLGEAYRKLRRLDLADDHAAAGLAATAALPDDGYGRMIRGGLDALVERIADDRASAG